MFGKVFGKIIIGFKENSITQFALLTLRGDFAMLLLLLLSINTLSFSQIEVVKSDYGRYKINGKSQTLHRGVNNFTTALNDGIRYKINHPDSIIKIQFSRNDIIILDDLKMTDTLTISGGWHMTGKNGNYYRYPACGDIIKIEADSIIKWQTDIELIRLRSFGKSTYRDTGRVPFQFVCDTITRNPGVTTYRWQTFATEKHCIKTFIDGVYTGEADESCDPGAIDYHGANLRRHTNSADNLQPNTTYKILVEGTTDEGHFNIIEFIITTLPTEAPVQMSGVKME